MEAAGRPGPPLCVKRTGRQSAGEGMMTGGGGGGRRGPRSGPGEGGGTPGPREPPGSELGQEAGRGPVTLPQGSVG